MTQVVTGTEWYTYVPNYAHMGLAQSTKGVEREKRYCRLLKDEAVQRSYSGATVALGEPRSLV